MRVCIGEGVMCIGEGVMCIGEGVMCIGEGVMCLGCSVITHHLLQLQDPPTLYLHALASLCVTRAFSHPHFVICYI